MDSRRVTSADPRTGRNGHLRLAPPGGTIIEQWEKKLFVILFKI